MFVDRTVIGISRAKIYKKILYKGHKRVHGIKCEGLALRNGLIGNLSAFMRENDMIVARYK